MRTKISSLFLIHALISGIAISFFFTTYQLFLKGKGMSLLEINLINGFFMAAVFLLEVPTGAFADATSRVRSIVSGSLLLAVSFGAYFFAHSFWQFVGAEIIGALGQSLINGAIQSWLISWLNTLGESQRLKKLFARQVSISQIGIMVGALVGSQLGSYNLAWPWLASAFSFVLVAIFVAFFPENHEQRVVAKVSFTAIFCRAREGFLFSLKRKSILYIAAFSALFFFCLQAVNMYWPLFFADKGITVSKLGPMFFGVSLATIIGAKIGELIPKKSEEKRSFLVVPQIVTGLAIIALTFSLANSWIITFFLLHEAARGFYKPVLTVQLNAEIPERIRATVNSFESMCEKFGAFLGLLISGGIAQVTSIGNSWLVSGIILLAGILLFYLFRKTVPSKKG